MWCSAFALAFFLPNVTGAHAAPVRDGRGQVLWQDRFDMGVHYNFGTALAAQGTTAVAVGIGYDAGFNDVWVVRAYDTRDGALRWQDQLPAGGNSGTPPRAVALAGQRAFVAGTAFGTTAGVLVRAYDLGTGALTWEHRSDDGRVDEDALAVAAHGALVFVAGHAGEEGFVRAYAANTGDLVWEDRFGGECCGLVSALAVHDSRLFAAGTVRKGAPTFDLDFVLRAYDTSTGRLLWQDVADVSGGEDFWVSVAAEGDQVVAGGSGTDFDLNSNVSVVRAYDASTGTLAWERTAVGVEARAVALRGNRVFVAESGPNEEGGLAFIVRSYDAVGGALIWRDVFSGEGGIAQPIALEVAGGRVLACGYALTGEPAFEPDFIVRAYESGTGALVWQDRPHHDGGDFAAAVAAAGGRVVAVGTVGDAVGEQDILVRAYELH
jgi:outer membrane protein assembly factor BamB